MLAMYEEIRKPRLLKDIPLTLIRALPTLYYANKFANQEIPEKIHRSYQSNVKFLNQALQIIGKYLKNKDFESLAKDIETLDVPPSTENIDKVQKFSISLAELCSDTKPALREQTHILKTALTEIYSSLVKTIHILVIDNSRGTEDIDKVLSILKNFCQYNVHHVQPDSQEYVKSIIESDFILLYSTSSPEIHQQVKSLKTYHLPGIAMVQFPRNTDPDKEAIRHGAQLIKIGFPVLFKMFTPIRMFTTIDKTYIQHHLKGDH
jgi:hypothetical protein